MNECRYDGCRFKHYGRGLCSKHYQHERRRARGTPERIVDLAARIDSAVERIPFSGCWIWLATVNHRGYGMMSVGDRTAPVHRLSWQAHRGPIPHGLYVLHRCDVRCCVNPAHLFLGTHQDNMDDMKAKGRSSFGERNALAKLTADSVREIRASGASSRIMAEQLGVSRSLIKQVRKGTIWAHV
jgi:hypothetical protein